MAQRDWLEWHEPYDDPSSRLSQRLAIVQDHLRIALDRCPAGAIRVISMCAGQGRDVIGVLLDHPRRADVRATLVELDERNVEIARAAAARLDVIGVEVVHADAGTTDAYVGSAPAEVVLACGIFGNIADDAISLTVATLPSLCAPGATVIWTRHRVPPDLTPTIRVWFEEAGFAEEAFYGPGDAFIGVGVHRFVGDPRPLAPGTRLFAFAESDGAAAR